MDLKKEKRGQYTYFELYLSCPVCLEYANRHTPKSFWQHHSCGGRIYVGDNAHYGCDSCTTDEHVSVWSYGCPYHSRDKTNLEYLKVSMETVAISMSTAGQLVSATGMAWLQRFMQNLENWR